MPTTPAAAARQILVLLQEVMASRNSAQAKLNKVVEIIGQSLSSEVCSIYLVREGVLELFATRGLKQEAVHVTRMAMGEGLVGLIATNVETLNLDEAAAHPDFSYRPDDVLLLNRPAPSPVSQPSRGLHAFNCPGALPSILSPRITPILRARRYCELCKANKRRQLPQLFI